MRRIAVFTGTRAEYGLLYWLMKEIRASHDLELQLIVSGMHLSPEFGETWKMIEQEGFAIDAKVEMLLSSDTPVGVAKSIGIGTVGFADALGHLCPDILVVLGDRFEVLAIVSAAVVMRIPIAHLHGGELTEGVIDESIRHAITKMAQLHFVSTDVYRKRVIQLGEQPERVFNVGATGLENIIRLKLLDKTELEDSLDFELGASFFLVTYHPVTLSEDGGMQALKNLLMALDQFPESKVVMTFPNADTCGRSFIPLLENYASKKQNKILLTPSVGQLRYLSLMSMCDAVIGNSSSGLLEAPAFRVPTVDIGARQKGRLRSSTVIHCDEDFDSIRDGIEKALSEDFRRQCRLSVSPYGDGRVADKIIKVLRKISLERLVYKRFYDLDSG